MKLDRTKYKVPVSGKKQIKQFKQALLAVGETIDFNCFSEREGDRIDSLVYAVSRGWIVCWNGDSNEKGITFKELLKLIVNDVEEVKPGLLDRDVQVIINNEREYDLIQSYRKKLGFGISLNSSSSWRYPMHALVNDTMHYSVPLIAGKEIITFEAFAIEAGIKLPVFVMMSEDGVDLFQLDPVFIVSLQRLTNGTWNSPLQKVMTTGVVKSLKENPDFIKPFYSKKAAEEWVEKKNKPKSTVLFNNTPFPVEVFADHVVFKIMGVNQVRISTEELKQVVIASDSLQPF